MGYFDVFARYMQRKDKNSAKKSMPTKAASTTSQPIARGCASPLLNQISIVFLNLPGIYYHDEKIVDTSSRPETTA